MKRGLITWDKSEIPPVVFERRIERVRRLLADRQLSAAVVYSDLWRSNQARFLSNYMPYFNRALLIVPDAQAATLLCGLSPRVYTWIRSVTTIEDVRPAGNFAKPLFELAAERNWKRIGIVDDPQLPHDIYKAIHSGPLEVLNVEGRALYVPAEDQTELTMRRKTAAMARSILADELPKGVRGVDHHFVGILERRFRKAGAEDLITLVTNGDSVPAPPAGKTLAELREMIQQDITKQKEADAERDKKNQIMAHLLAKVECELPQGLVRNETRRVMSEIVRENQQRGVPDEALKENEKEIVGSAAQSAKDRLKGTFILVRIAEQDA